MGAAGSMNPGPESVSIHKPAFLISLARKKHDFHGTTSALTFGRGGPPPCSALIEIQKWGESGERKNLRGLKNKNKYPENII